MANYGRGWDDGYGGQSAQSIDAYQERQEREAGQIQNAANQRAAERKATDAMTAPQTDVPTQKVAIIVEAIPQPWRRAISHQQDEIDAQDATIAALVEALDRQCDNMAFVINHITVPDGWYEKLIAELAEDRAALAKAAALK